MKLNTLKINKELKRLGKSQKWLATKIKVSPQLLYYWLKKQNLRGADKIGKALNISPKDLII